MNMKILAENKTAICIFLILLAAATRLFPHPLNFTPMGAIGLFAGAYFYDRRVWLVPVIALLVSDAVIGFYQPLVMLFVYLGFAVSVFIGSTLLYRTRTAFRLGVSAVVTATVFFILSNMGVWLTGLYYPMTRAGLVECYILALPFFGNTLLGDLFYVACLFGIVEMIQSWVNARSKLSTA